MTTESNNELILDGGGASITVKGGEEVDWATLLPLIFGSWDQMRRSVHSDRLEEIRAEQGGRVGPASAGFTSEQSAERRNGMLPGGTGAMPV